jgi:predicted ATPase
VLLTFRPEVRPPWPPREHISHVTLDRLAGAELEAMATRVARGKRLPDAVVRDLIAKSDGVPLFIEELTKAVVESGLVRETDDHWQPTGSRSELTIPSTLQDSLMSRLDRLGDARGVAQLAPSLGRDFRYDVRPATAITAA